MLSVTPEMLSLETLSITDCDELEHMVVDIGSNGNELGINVFPKLKVLNVKNCRKMKYIFGHINAGDDHDQNNNEIQLHLRALRSLKLSSLSSLIGLCPKQHHTTFPPLKELELVDCSRVDVKSIGDLTFLTSISRYHDSTTVKQFNGNMEHFLALERLEVSESNVESLLCLNEESEREIDLGFQNIILRKLPIMIYLVVSPRNAFALKNLKSMTISQCEKLETVFSISVLRCLSQLSHLRIQECNELKYIIEDDIKNQRMSNFPVLKSLAVVKCNKLKSVFPISMKKELPELKVMLIRDADELEEIFKSVVGDDQKVEIPKLKVVVFINLPSLCHVQGIQFQAVETHFIQNCKEFNLTSLTSSGDYGSHFFHTDGIDFDARLDLFGLFQQLEEDMLTSSQGIQVSVEERTVSTSYANTITPSTHLESEYGDRLPVSTTESLNIEDVNLGDSNKTTQGMPSAGNSPTNSQELMNEQSMDQQHLKNQELPLGEIDAIIKSSQLEDGTTSEKTEETTMSTTSEQKDEPDVQLYAPKQKGIEICVEDGPTSANAKTISSSTHSKSVSSSSTTSKSETSSLMEGSTTTSEKNVAASLSSISETTNEAHVQLVDPNQKGVEGRAKLTNAKTITSSTHLELEQDVDVRDSQETTKNNNDQVSLNYGAFVKETTITEEQFSKDDPSASNVLPLPFSLQTHSMPFQGNPSQKVEDLSSHSLVTCELEQLVSKKLMATENLSLLTDFLVKHPSVLLRDTSLNNRYKGYAYNCLSELLKFLQTHSVLDVLGSSYSEFVELLKDARRFPFDKDWLDDVEKRSLFPGSQVSEAALQKLLDSKHLLTQHVEDLKHQLASSEAVLETIIRQEAQVLETRASLSDPIGY